MYKIYIEKVALKSLTKIDHQHQTRLINSIRELAKEPRPKNSKKLKGRNAFRIRIGNYRIIYEIEHEKLTILVVSIGHRKNIYR